MPSLDTFIESLIQEHNKLIQMGSLIASSNQSLLASETRNVQARRKHKGKEKRNTEFELKDALDPSLEALISRKDKH